MNEEERVIEERKRKLKDIFLKKNLWMYLGLIVLLLLAWQIRTANVDKLKDVTTGDYTLGPDLDPFLFLRYAQDIVATGSIPMNDTMRYVPLGFNTLGETKLLPYMMAYFHKTFIIFSPSATVNYTAGVIFPVFMFLLTVIAFYLLARKIFEDKKYKDLIAFVATFILIVSPSILARTIAGIPEKESAGFFFLFIAFYFFLCAWKSEKLNKVIIFASLAGIATGLMGLIWGGWIYIFTTLAVFIFLAFIFGALNKKKILGYTIWLVISFIVPLVFSHRYTLTGLATSTSSGLSLILLLLIGVDFVINHTRIKELKIVKKSKERLPEKLVSIIAFIIIGIIASSVLFGINFIPNFFGDIASHLTSPYSDRLSFTVAENKQPYFSDWTGSFGPVVKGFPLIFCLFFIGGMILFYEAVKHLEKKKRMILTLSFILFLIGLIFSRYSSTGTFNGDNGISHLVYYGSFILIAVVFCYIFYKYHQEKNLEELSKVNFAYIFLISYFIVSIIGARSAVRLVMALDPAASLLVGYFAVSIAMRAIKTKDETWKIVIGIVATIVVLSTVYAAYSNYQTNYNAAKNFAPSIYSQQWQYAMSWVRNSTAQDAVFSHWWDYGYWVQSIGERPTVLDGGNAISYWNHLIARHVLTSNNETDAQEFLYTHNVSYLLIDSTDIGKYTAYSNIGSDENYDRYSWIPEFTLDESATTELKNETVLIYTGGFPLDQDFEYKTNSSKIIYPAGKSGVGAVRVIIGADTEIKAVDAVFVYKGKQQVIPMNCLYLENHQYQFYNNGYDGCFYIIPSIGPDSSGNLGINKIGSGMFLSERVKNTLFAKLYLFDKGKNFKLAHTEDDLFVKNLKEQNIIDQTQDFVSYGGIRGPIKIWKVNYDKSIKANPDYLKTEYPKNVLYV